MIATDQLVHGNANHVLGDDDGAAEGQYNMLDIGELASASMFCDWILTQDMCIGRY
jgi:hypothetical protein